MHTACEAQPTSWYLVRGYWYLKRMMNIFENSNDLGGGGLKILLILPARVSSCYQVHSWYKLVFYGIIPGVLPGRRYQVPGAPPPGRSGITLFYLGKDKAKYLDY